jgi:monovalent cation:proton antiporter-2 (CPA2) family protein
MHGQNFFYQALVYLSAAVISVPIAKRLGFGSVLGYLIAGVVIGPFGLGLIGEEGKDVMHFAEFGVVMMLFLVGLELQPSLFWRLRGPILGTGGLQVGITTSLFFGTQLALGLSWRPALAIGMTLALSSTAMVLQTLNEKGLVKTDAGQRSFAVLLFQDVAVIPMLALMPLLATGATEHRAGASTVEHGARLLENLPGWAQTLIVLTAVATIVLGGRFVVRPAFRLIAKTRLREIFTAAALLLVIAIALLMTVVGLSPALGTFLAGVVLAESEYRHELVTDIEPFKGLLLGLFFIAVGASIDFGLVAQQPSVMAALVLGLVAFKFAVLYTLGFVHKMGSDQRFLFAFALAQGGEFAFVLFSFATGHGVLPKAMAEPLMAVVALSMALTPLLLLINERLVQPRFGTKERQEGAADVVDEDNPVIIAGFGRFGGIVGRLLVANGIEATILDIDSDHVEVLRKLGFKVFYGDASRHDLLEAAGAERARLLVLAIDDQDRELEIIELVQKRFPHLSILARASNRQHAYELLDAGVDHVYRETLDTALRAGADALRMLGFRGYEALRAARTFRHHDEAALKDLAELRHDTKVYLRHARQSIEELEALLRAELEAKHEQEVDAAWDTDSIRRDLACRSGEEEEQSEPDRG